jgi:hypothetical protein
MFSFGESLTGLFVKGVFFKLWCRAPGERVGSKGLPALAPASFPAAMSFYKAAHWNKSRTLQFTLDMQFSQLQDARSPATLPTLPAEVLSDFVCQGSRRLYLQRGKIQV